MKKITTLINYDLKTKGEMMKLKKRAFLVCIGLLSLGATFEVSAETSTNTTDLKAGFQKWFPTDENGKVYISRDPLNPKLPFPASVVYKTLSNQNKVDGDAILDVEDKKYGNVTVNGQTYWGQLEFDLDPTQDTKNNSHEDFLVGSEKFPKLYSYRDYYRNPEDITSDYYWPKNTTDDDGDSNDGVPARHGIADLGLVYLPSSWNFGSVEDSNGSAITLVNQGDKAHYTDDISHLQVWDNRLSKSDLDWEVQVEMSKEPTDENGNILTGAVIEIPKGISRNEFNGPSGNGSESDKGDAKFEAYAVTVGKSTGSATIWKTKSSASRDTKEAQTTGKGMSTLTWETEDVKLQIPSGRTVSNGNYSMRLRWTILQSAVPET